MPADAADQSEVLADVRRMLIDAGLDEAQTVGEDAPPREVIAVSEVRSTTPATVLSGSTIAPILDEIGGCGRTATPRLELALRALTGSLTGLGESLDRIADDAEHEAIDTEALRRAADRSYEGSRPRFAWRSAAGRSSARRHYGTGKTSWVLTR